MINKISYLISFCLVSLLFCITQSELFPPHLDLQKVGKIYFKNENYNILKPSLHVIRDHFKDFMQRRGTNDFPTKRLFLDKNGFRHYWSGFENKDNKDSRKSDTIKNKVGESQKIKTKKVNGTLVRRKPKRKKKVVETVTPEKTALRKDEGGNQTKVLTSIFCPFFGVITMQSYID